MITKRRISDDCESCEFYNWDEEYETYVCTQNLDQDEMSAFLLRKREGCPYYRHHDEYETVKKQI